MANIITLTGPAHCGKSTTRNLFLERNNDNFKPVLFKKYTTRAPRISDDDVISCESIPDKCDFVYEQYGVRYGFSFDELYTHLTNGESPIIVINDVRAVEDLRTAVGSQVISIFLYRKPADLDEFMAEELGRAKKNVSKKTIEKTARTRFDKAKTIYRIYIENIHLFDYTILNVADIECTKRQVEHIISKITTSIEGLKGVDE